MVAAAFYVLSFIFAVSMLIVLPKTRKKINIIVDVMFSYVTVLNIAAFVTFFINILGISVSLVSMGAVFACIGILFVIMILVKRKIQSHYLRKADAISVCVLVFSVGLLMLYVFTPYIHANYYNNVDPYNHFLYAKTIIRTGHLSRMFYNSLYNAMFIELFSWAMPQSWGYKAFILSDIYHIIVELLFFYAALVLLKEKRKNGKYAELFWSLFYWISFLLFSFLWGFVYWSMATMLAEYVFLLVKMRKESETPQKIMWGYIGVGLFAVTMCYIQFAPIMVCAVAAVVIYDLYKEGKISFQWSYIKYAAGIAVTLMIVALVGYKYVFHDTGIDFFSALKTGEQQNIGLEVILMLPWVMLIILQGLRESKRLTAMQVAYLASMSVQMLFTILSICHIVSTYYLQKNYFILLFLSIIIIIEGKSGLSKEIVRTANVVCVGCLGFLMLSYAGSESKTFSLQQSTLVQNMDIMFEHDFSKGELSDNGKIYLMQYAMEELKTEKDVIPLIISSGVGHGNGIWFDATYDNSTYIWIEDYQCTEDRMDELLKERKATYFIVFFDDLLYIYDLHEYFDSFERIYQNDAGFIGKVN